MNKASDSEKKADLQTFSFRKNSEQNSVSTKIAVNIRSYPEYTCAIAETALINDIKKLSEYLAHIKCNPKSSSLYCLEKYYLCLTIKTKETLKILPAICEHSERVYLGKSYEAAIKEHACPLISENAAGKLCS